MSEEALIAGVERGRKNPNLTEDFRKSNKHPPPEAVECHLYDRTALKFQGRRLFASGSICDLATVYNEKVMISWRYYKDSSRNRERLDAFRKRMEKFNKVLSSGPTTLHLSILYCLGYFYPMKDFIGHIFRLPLEVNPNEKPVTLHHILLNIQGHNKEADPADRFILAKALASAVFELHATGWIHGNFSSDNILFWSRRGKPQYPKIRKPYLITLDEPYSRFQHDICLPADHDDLRTFPFIPASDIYGLGVTLLEIGLWKNLGGLRPEFVFGPKDQGTSRDLKVIKREIPQEEISQLKYFAGTRYRDAVAACFKPDFDAIWAD